MPSIAQLSALAIVVVILFSAAALYLMYEIGRLVGEKTTADKFPEAKKAAVRRLRSVLGGLFAEQLAPYLPNFPLSPTRRNSSARRSTFSSSKAWTPSPSRK